MARNSWNTCFEYLSIQILLKDLQTPQMCHLTDLRSVSLSPSLTFVPQTPTSANWTIWLFTCSNKMIDIDVPLS